MKFVLLEHDTRPHPAMPQEPSTLHYDLFVDFDGRGRLAAWRLARSPLDVRQAIPAERIQDHRREYLEYEGEISGGRGRVRRLDRGVCDWLCLPHQPPRPAASAQPSPAAIDHRAAQSVRLFFRGEILRGAFELANHRFTPIHALP